MTDLSLAFDVLARDRASATLDRIGGSAGGMGEKFKGMAKVAGAALGAIALKLGVDSVKAFADAETAQAKLSNAFSKFPQLAGHNAEALRDLNTALAKKTKFDDDATASAQAVLAGFRLTEDQLKTITPLLQDYASRTGKDLPTAAQDLGKAILGQGRALKGIGLNFKDTGSEAGNFGQLVDGLRDKVGGFAAKEGTTAAGKVAILKNQFGEMQEAIGAKLLPVLLNLTDGLTALINFLGEHQEVVIALVTVVGVGLVAAFGAWATAMWAAVTAEGALLAPILAIIAAVALIGLGIYELVKNWDVVWAKIKEITGIVVEAVIDFVKGLPGRMVSALSAAWGAFKDLWGELLEGIKTLAGLAWDALVEFVKSLPGRLVDGIKAEWGLFFDVMGFLWTSVKNFAIDRFHELVDFVKSLPGLLRDGIVAEWHFVSDKFGELAGQAKDFAVGKFNELVDFIKGLPGKVKDAAAGLFDGIKDAAKAAINAVIKMWNDFELKINVPDWLPGPDEIVFRTPNIPLLHTGGTFQAPGIAQEGMAMLRNGETVSTPEDQRDMLAELRAIRAAVLRLDDTQLLIARTF